MENIKKETIVYNGKKYNRYPDSDRRQLRVYYWKHDTWKGSPIPLHRQIWIDIYGPIPDKHSIHHKDGNPENNFIENLEMLSSRDHSIKHMEERRKKRTGVCENPKCCKEFCYFSIRKAKYCSYKCYSVVRHSKK